MTAMRHVSASMVLGLVLTLLLVAGCGKPSVETIEIEPSSATVTVGQTIPLQASGRDAKGNVIEDVTFSWSVDSDLGSIDAQGRFTARKPGVVQVTVTADTKQAIARITIQRQAVAKIVGTAAATEVTVGGQTRVSVTVRNAAGNGIAGVEVKAEAVSAGTKVEPAVAVSNGSGQAAFTVTVGPTVGANTVRFRADAAQTTVVLQGVADVPARMRVAVASTTVVGGEETAVDVTIVDRMGNPVPGVGVRFAALSQGLTVPTEAVVTDAQGHARAMVRVGPKIGTNRLRLSAADLEAQVREIKSVAGDPAHLALQADSLATIAGGTVTLTVRVQDAHGNPVAGIPVKMAVSPADAKLDATTLTTNTNGMAYVSLRTSATPGDNVVQATLGTLPPARLTATGQPPVALQVLPQAATVAMQGSYHFRALASDAQGHTVEVKAVWKVVGDKGSIDQDGRFTATSLGSDVVLATYGDLTAGAQLTVVTGQVAKIEVRPVEATVVSGSSQQFQVTAYNAHGYVLDVTPTWRVSGGVGSIDTSGRFTAATAGRGEIVVTIGSSSARVPVTVSPGALAAIEISPAEVNLRAGAELQLQANGHDAAGNRVEIDPTWHLAADVGELTASGRFRALHVGEGRIRVQAGTRPVTAEIPVKVLPAALARIEVSPQTVTLSAGEAVQFSASGYDEFGNAVDLTPQWHLTPAVGRIDADGKFVARKTGSAKVQAIAGTVAGEASLVVKPGPLVALTLEPAEALNLTAGDTVSFSVVGHDEFGNIVTVTPTWTQSEALGRLTAEGQFRAETVGSTEIRVEAGTQSAAVRVNIAPGKLAKIAVSPANVTVAAGETVRFSASGYDAYDNAVDIQVGWRVTQNLGDIDADGRFHAMQAQEGEVIATAAGISGRTSVTVTPGALMHLEVTPRHLDLTAGDKAQITVIGYDAFGNPMATQPVWQVTEGMGTITPAGEITAKKAGSGRVVAAVDQLAIVIGLKVAKGDLATIRIEPPTVRLASGSQRQLTVQGFDLGGNPIAVEAAWAVRGDVGSIDANGVFTGVRAAAGTIVATVGSLQAEAEVIVEPGAVASLRVTPESANLAAGDRLHLKSAAFDAAGNRVSTMPEWTVQPDLGRISDTGLFQAMRAGSGTITATIGRVQQTVAIKVQAGPLSTIRLLPAKLVITAGGELQFTATGYDAYGNAVPISPQWSLVGSIGQVDAKRGTFLAKTAGSGTIVAVVDSIAGLAAVTVEAAGVARLHLVPQEITLAAGEKLRVALTAFDAYDNIVAVSPTWRLSAPLGLLTDGRFEARRVGTTEIVATAGGVTARTRVEIQPGPMVRLQVTPKRAQIPSGESLSFRVLGYDAFDNARQVDGAWQLQGEIGRLDATGVFTAGPQGQGQIVVRVGRLSGQSEVVVVPGKVRRLMITPPRAEVAATVVQQFRALGLDAGGNQIPVTISWALSGDIGSIDPSGRFTAARVGTGHVVAYHDSLLQTAAVEVTPGPVALLFVTPQRAAVAAGETVPFEVRAFDVLQNPVTHVQPRWAVVGDIGDIDPDTGVFSARRQGWGKVQATVDGVTGNADVQVGHGQPDAKQSRMVASRVEVLADGKTTAEIIVLVRDRYGNPVPEARVTLISSREDRIDQPLPSNQHGVAIGRIRSSTPGQSEVNAVVASGRISNSLRLTFLQAGVSG